MKVLMLHNRYKQLGGEDICTDAEVALLRANDVEVDTFFLDNDIVDNLNKVKLALNTVWSRYYYKALIEKINKGKYDIIHVQNFFPLFSPSIFYAAKKTGTKVVMTVHNYRLICPNGLMYVNNNICQECVGKTLATPSLFKKCYRDNYLATGVTAAMLGFHNMMQTWNNKIDGYICITDFVKKQLQLGKIREDKLFVKPNFVTVEIAPVFNPEDYYIFVGRIAVEKNIELLLKTFEKNKKKLLIAGDGPMKDIVIKSAEKHSNIVYLGKLSLSDTYKKIAYAKAFIFPSKWHEPFGRTIIESFAHGTPVIGSSLGGITELIEDGYNGYLFNPYIASDLDAAINKLEESKDSNSLRHHAYLTYQTKYTEDINFKMLIDIYNTV